MARPVEILGRHFVARAVSRRQYRPEAELALLKSFLLPGDLVADVGANVGPTPWKCLA
jgi:hypothetical protein